MMAGTLQDSSSSNFFSGSKNYIIQLDFRPAVFFIRWFTRFAEFLLDGENGTTWFSHSSNTERSIGAPADGSRPLQM